MSEAEAFEKNFNTAIRHLKTRDKKLAAIIKRVGKLGLPPKSANSFDTLAQIIIGQQLSAKAAMTIFRRVQALNGGKKLTADAVAAMSDARLQSAGVSRPKIRGLRSLVEHVQSSRLKLPRLPHMSDDDVYEAITQVKGLGPWSAHIYLMFVLRRLDIFPIQDLGLKKAVQNTYGDNADAETVSEKWRPYRTVACWYLWHSLDHPES